MDKIIEEISNNLNNLNFFVTYSDDNDIILSCCSLGNLDSDMIGFIIDNCNKPYRVGKDIIMEFRTFVFSTTDVCIFIKGNPLEIIKFIAKWDIKVNNLKERIESSYKDLQKKIKIHEKSLKLL